MLLAAAYVNSFSDASCLNAVGSSSYELSCDNTVNDYFSTNQYSTDLKCSVGSGRPLPVFPSADYATQNYYDSGTEYTCDDGELSAFQSYVENYCFSYEDFSFKIIFPSVYDYYDANCNDLYATYDLNLDCIAYDTYYSTDADSKSEVHSKSRKSTEPQYTEEKKYDSKSIDSYDAAYNFYNSPFYNHNFYNSYNYSHNYNYYDNHNYFNSYYYNHHNNYHYYYNHNYFNSYYYNHRYSNSYTYYYYDNSHQTVSMSRWVQDHGGPSGTLFYDHMDVYSFES